jgi:hypothetical protein
MNRKIAGSSGGKMPIADVNKALQESTGREDYAVPVESLADLRFHSLNLSVIYDERFDAALP